MEDIRRLRGLMDNLLNHPELDTLLGGKANGFSTGAPPRDPKKGRGL